MNSKEMEAAVRAMGDRIEALASHGERRHDVGAVDELKEGLALLKGQFEEHSKLSALQVLQIVQAVQSASVAAEAARSAASELEGRLAAALDRIEDLSAKVEGRNKSAPVKRNMTDRDALNVLDGETKDVGHKEAAERLGLTYAQVYSCRLGFTFKHVIRDLEKGGWKSPWAKG